MKTLCNEGELDRIVRAIAGVVMLAAGFIFGSWFGLIGLIPIATAIVGFCPIYALVGFSTCPQAR